MLNSFQHLVKFSSAVGRHTFHPRPQDRVFRCDLNKDADLLGVDLSKKLREVKKTDFFGGIENEHLRKIFR